MENLLKENVVEKVVTGRVILNRANLFCPKILYANSEPKYSAIVIISKEDIELVHLMRSTYYRAGLELEVFYGVLKHDVELIEEVNKLEWIEIEGENFFDMKKYAGEGNIGHILEWIKYDMNK